MNQLQQITSDPYQTQEFIMPDGTSFTMTLRYAPMQYGWYIEELVYGDFRIKGIRVCNSPNMLYQFKNQIPFGLACFTKGNREPTQQQDFSSQTAILYLLTEEEVEEYAEYLSGQVSS